MVNCTRIDRTHAVPLRIRREDEDHVTISSFEVVTDVRCPRCSATQHYHCQTPRGMTTRTPHRERAEAFARLPALAVSRVSFDIFGSGLAIRGSADSHAAAVKLGTALLITYVQFLEEVTRP